MEVVFINEMIFLINLHEYRYFIKENTTTTDTCIIMLILNKIV
jgi:hypothetical protein